MRPYSGNYTGGKSFVNLQRLSIRARLDSFLPSHDYTYFDEKKGDYEAFVRKISSSYDRFVSGLESLYRKPKTNGLALKIVEESTKQLGLKQFAQLANIVADDLDLEATLDGHFGWEASKYELVNYLRHKIPKNVDAHIEFYDGRKLINEHKLDKNFTICNADLPSAQNGRIVVTVIDQDAKYTVEFTLRRYPSDKDTKNEGFKLENTPCDMVVRPKLLEKRL